MRKIYNLKALVRMVMCRGYIDTHKKLHILKGYGIVCNGNIEGVYHFVVTNTDPMWCGKRLKATPRVTK